MALRSLYNHVIDRLARAMAPRLARYLARELLNQPRRFGPAERLHLDPTAIVNDCLFNLISGDITVGPWSTFGHGVSLLTGTHEIDKLGLERQESVPDHGRDIVIGAGAWLAGNVTVLGPCVIGEHAVVGAGSLVRSDVAPFTIVAGVPARIIGQIATPAEGG